jgi:hypothetical protein
MSELSLEDVLSKTALGRREQQQRSQALGAKQRHVLILCDGRRSLGELCALMGDAVLPLAQDLLASGHVERVGVARAAPPLAPSAVPAAQLAQAVAPTPRRSIALSRMYMFDMIERTLGHHSGPARAHLRAADQSDALLLALQECLLLIEEVAGQAQADKVRAQLCTMLPEDWVEHVERPLVQRPEAALATGRPSEVTT